MRRRILAIAVLTFALVGCAWPAATAKDLGTDVIGNISPESRLGAWTSSRSHGGWARA